MRGTGFYQAPAIMVSDADLSYRAGRPALNDDPRRVTILMIDSSKVEAYILASEWLEPRTRNHDPG
jgi:hypothetical protein